MAIISVGDLMNWMDVSNTESTMQDASFTFAVNAANQAVTAYCGRTFEVTTSGSESARVFRPKTQVLAKIDDFATTDGLTVKIDSGDDGTYESTLTLNTDYLVEPLNGMEDGLSVPYRRLVATSWVFSPENTFPNLQVTARWGWTAVPDSVTQAALIKGARVFKRRVSPEGVVGGFQDFGAIRITNREDPDCQMLLAPYRRAEQVLYA